MKWIDCTRKNEPDSEKPVSVTETSTISTLLRCPFCGSSVRVDSTILIVKCYNKLIPSYHHLGA